jgi:hypothetical protein
MARSRVLRFIRHLETIALIRLARLSRLLKYRVYNLASSDNLTMCWYGISQYGSLFADGSPYSRRWPILVGKYFDFEFQFDSDIDGTLYFTKPFCARRLLTGIILASARNL